MSLCLIASVQTSLTMLVHLCKILYVTPLRGVQEKKKTFFFFFPLCNIKPLCISLLPVYFIKVLQNYENILRYNWDLETLSFKRLLWLASRFTVCTNKKEKKILSDLSFLWNLAKCAIKVQSEVIGTSGSCLFGFVHSMYNHFIF